MTLCVMVFLVIEIVMALRKVMKMRKIVLQQAYELGL